MATPLAQAGDLVMIIGADQKRFLLRLEPGQKVHTHLGFIEHNAVIGRPFGSSVSTHLGHPFLILPLSTWDLVMRIKRASQIVYPKEIGYILLKLNIRPGARVIEAGTGSGALTLALARMVQPNGWVYSYEERDDMLELAQKNLTRAGITSNVILKKRDIRAGFDERGVEALFLDVREPWMFLDQAHAALQGGGFFGALVPTTNQISDLLQEMERGGGWAEVEVLELLERNYKVNADRLRPMDRMVAHTGYLIFARAVERQANLVERGEPEGITSPLPEEDSVEREELEGVPPHSSSPSPRGLLMSDQPKLVVVHTSAGELTAQAIRAKLTSAGIPALLQGESANVLSFTVDGMGEYRVVVPEGWEKEARAVLTSRGEAFAPTS
jgi:tRNA (adenine57-N1/adenine58-N1)-methyltransferase